MLTVSLLSTFDVASCHLEDEGLLADSELSRGGSNSGGETDLDGADGTEVGLESCEFREGDTLVALRLGVNEG